MTRDVDCTCEGLFRPVSVLYKIVDPDSRDIRESEASRGNLVEYVAGLVQFRWYCG